MAQNENINDHKAKQDSAADDKAGSLSQSSKHTLFSGDLDSFEQSRAFVHSQRATMGAQAYAAMAKKAYQTNMPNPNQVHVGSTFDAYDDQDESLQRTKRPMPHQSDNASVWDTNSFNGTASASDTGTGMGTGTGMDAGTGTGTSADVGSVYSTGASDSAGHSIDEHFNAKLAGSNGAIQDAQIYVESEDTAEIQEPASLEDSSTTTSTNNTASNTATVANSPDTSASSNNSHNTDRDHQIPSSKEWSDFMSRLSQYPDEAGANYDQASSLNSSSQTTAANSIEATTATKAQQEANQRASLNDGQALNADLVQENNLSDTNSLGRKPNQVLDSVSTDDQSQEQYEMKSPEHHSEPNVASEQQSMSDFASNQEQIPSGQQWSEFMERLAHHNDAMRAEGNHAPAEENYYQGQGPGANSAAQDPARFAHLFNNQAHASGQNQGLSQGQAQAQGQVYGSGQGSNYNQYMNQAQAQAQVQAQAQAQAQANMKANALRQALGQGQAPGMQGMSGAQGASGAFGASGMAGQAQQGQGQGQGHGQGFGTQGQGQTQGAYYGHNQGQYQAHAQAQAQAQAQAMAQARMNQAMVNNDMDYAKKEKLSENLAFHILMVAVISLCLLIPTMFFEYVLNDRQYTEEMAIESIVTPWGEDQTLSDPIVVVPTPMLSKKYVNSDDETTVIESIETKNFYVYPDDANSQNKLSLEKRSRGNYVATLYKVNTEQKGSFDLRHAYESIMALSKVDHAGYDEIYLYFPVEYKRSIGEIAFVNINGKDFVVEPSSFDTGFMVTISPSEVRKIINGEPLGHTSNQDSNAPALYNSLDAKAVKANESNNAVAQAGEKEFSNFSLLRPGELRYHAKFEVRGSQKFSYMALGNQTFTNISGVGTVPSFAGNYLPTEHSIDEQALSFDAIYKQSNLASGRRQIELDEKFRFSDENSYVITIADRSMSYILIERLTKYVLLFIAMTFVTVLAFEIVAKRTVSLVQYVVIGVALVLFYMVLLSLNEHTNFTISYIVAALLMSSMVALYLKAVLDSKRNAICVFLLLLAMYAVLFAIVHIQAYALLVGTILLVIMLGVVMFITRKLNATKS